MNFQQACNILDINRDKCSYIDIDLITLRKAYYKAALLYHPDRNLSNESEIYKQRFQEIGEAYSFLETYIKIKNEDTRVKEETHIKEETTSFFGFKECIDQLITKLDLKKASLTVFEGLNINTAINVFNYINEYHELLGIKKDFIESFQEVVKNKTQNDKIIIIKPTIKNILNNDIFQIKYNGKTYYVPVWHDELRYDIETTNSYNENNENNQDDQDDQDNQDDQDDQDNQDNQDNQDSQDNQHMQYEKFNSPASPISTHPLVIKCEPKLDSNITIDHNNNLLINITINSIQELFKKQLLIIPVGEDHSFTIPVHKLRIQREQTYTIYEEGISLINTKNIYEIKKKGNILINIRIQE
jgi:curved DNA-binding protein CbpA